MTDNYRKTVKYLRADEREIRAAYRKLAKDMDSPGCGEVLDQRISADLQDAYEPLSDGGKAQRNTIGAGAAAAKPQVRAIILRRPILIFGM